MLRIAVPVILIAAIAFGVHWFLVGRYQVKTDNAYIRSDITAVAPRVAGYVSAIYVDNNQPVKAGDLLVTLESQDTEAKLEEMRATLAQAEADAAQARARVAAQRDQLAEAVAAREASSAAAGLASSDLERLSSLAEKGWYPKARLDQAEAANRTAKAQLAQADATVTAQRSQLTSTEAAARSSDARVEAARAQLDAAQVDHSRSDLRAPVDGVIANKDVSPGQLLSPGQVAMSIVPANDAYIVANYKETQLEHMAPGQHVKIHVDAYPDLKVTGCVESLSPATGSTFSLIPQDTATGNFTKIVQRVPVKILLDDAALQTGLMRSGLAVETTVITKPGATGCGAMGVAAK
ncbi:MAG: HlyD family secretion protein [Hyphomonadaceae bacterium]